MKTIACRAFARVTLVFTLGFATVSAARAKTDAEILDNMQQRIRVLNEQLAHAHDGAQREELRHEVMAALDDALQQLSPASRPMLEVSVKILQPLMNDMSAYMNAVQKDTPLFIDYRGIKSREDLAARTAKLDELQKTNQHLLERVNAFESDADKMIAASGISEEMRAGFIDGVHRGMGKKIAALRALRGIDRAYYEQWQEAFKLLDDQWGKWHVGADGQPVFDDAAAQAKFAAFVKERRDLASRSTAATQAALGTAPAPKPAAAAPSK